MWPSCGLSLPSPGLLDALRGCHAVAYGSWKVRFHENGSWQRRTSWMQGNKGDPIFRTMFALVPSICPLYYIFFLLGSITTLHSSFYLFFSLDHHTHRHTHTHLYLKNNLISVTYVINFGESLKLSAPKRKIKKGERVVTPGHIYCNWRTSTESIETEAV